MKKFSEYNFMKIAVVVLLVNGIAWIWCSYGLALIGKTEIAETLSGTVVTEILGVILVYAIKSLIENLSKNNHWPDKPKKETSAEAAEISATENNKGEGDT